MRFSFIVCVFLTLLLSVCLQPATQHVDAANATPDTINGMNKFVVMKGEEALYYIQKTHIGKIEHVEDIAVLHYYSNRSLAVVWVTVYPDDKTAENETLKMVKSMKRFGKLWAEVEKTELDGIKVFHVPVKNHYFFVDKKYVIYMIPYNMTYSDIDVFIHELFKSIK